MKMTLQKILSRFQKLHPKEIDLSLDRIKNLCTKLGNPQDKIKAISVVGTNGKNSTIQACYSILKEAGIKCNVYTSPHIQKINERFVFNNQKLGDDELASLFEEVEKVNENNPITFFEILTACFFACSKRKKILSFDIGDDNTIVPVTKYFVSSKDFSKFKISFSINFLLRTSSAKHECELSSKPEKKRSPN